MTARLVTTIRRQLRANAERSRLRRELAGYDTDTQRDDLLATFARYPDEVAGRCAR
ncbi:hypothetical protein BH20ACT6_BH20ACT6_16410 [soil metagenome]